MYMRVCLYAAKMSHLLTRFTCVYVCVVCIVCSQGVSCFGLYPQDASFFDRICVCRCNKMYNVYTYVCYVQQDAL